MTSVKKRTSCTAKWTADDLQGALKAIKEGRPMTEAAALYGVPRTTIYTRFKLNKFSSPKMGRTFVFTPEQEQILTNHIIKFQNTNPVNSNQFRKMAFDLAEKLQLDHNFSRKKQEAGKGWLSAFLERNPRAQVIKKGDKNQKAKELDDENLDSSDSYDEDMCASETENKSNNEFIKMEVDPLEHPESLDFQPDPLGDNLVRVKIKRNEFLTKSEEQTNRKRSTRTITKLNQIQKELGIASTLGEGLTFGEEFDTIQSGSNQETEVDKIIPKSNRFVDRKHFLNQLEESYRLVSADGSEPANKKRGKRVTKIATWTAEDLNAALQAMAEGKTMRAASALHGVPRATIYRRLRMNNFSSPKVGRTSVFTSKQEKYLTDYILEVSNVCPMSTIQFRAVAFELADKLNLDHNFNKDIRLAGKDWLTAFMKRNPRAIFEAEGSILATTSYQGDDLIFSLDFEKLIENFPSSDSQSSDA